MFALPGYDAFLGFLLIAAAVPALALITNKLRAKSRAGERQLTYESGMEPIGGLDSIQYPLLHVRAGLRHL